MQHSYPSGHAKKNEAKSIPSFII